MRYQNKNHLLRNELEIIHRVDIDQTESLQSNAESETEANQPQSSSKTSTAAESLTHLFATHGLTGTESEPLEEWFRF